MQSKTIIHDCELSSFFVEKRIRMKTKAERFFTNPIIICIFALLSCMLWGSATPCIKTGYQMFHIDSHDIGTVFVFAGLRFFLAGILTILVTSLISKRFLYPTKGNWGHVLELGMVQTVIQYIFFYIGLANASGIKSCIVQGTNVFIALLVASLIFKMEKLTLQKIAGCLVGFTGIVLVNVVGKAKDTAGFTFLGEGFVILSIVAYSFSSVMVKRFSQTELSYTLSGYQFLFGGMVLTILGYIMGGRIHGFTVTSTILLIYMAFISATAYTLWGLLLKYNPVGKVTVFSCTTPVFGVIMSAIFLKEGSQVSPVVIVIALLLICVGITMVNRSKD